MSKVCICNNCSRYDPYEGICKLWDDYRHGYDDACTSWVECDELDYETD